MKGGEGGSERERECVCVCVCLLCRCVLNETAERCSVCPVHAKRLTQELRSCKANPQHQQGVQGVRKKLKQ